MSMQAITREEALDLLKPERRQELRERAHEVTGRCVEKRFDFCSIINARSGRCSENCKWCAQSAHWKTSCENYGWVGTEACVRAAKEAEANGADRIGIVTSGRCLSREDVGNVCDAIRAMRKVTSIGLCASLGLLSEDDLANLKEAGLQRVHCNIEAAPSMFPSLCTTHTAADKLAPLRFAGGRRDMSDETAARCIYVGISAGIAGPLLTTPGADFDDDRELAARAGYAVSAHARALPRP